jgi:cell division protein FtsB
VVLALTAVAFAVQGGEFGTSDLVSQQLRKRKLAAAIDSLERRVDSLAQVKQAIESDPAVQERIAREEFGMVKGDREVLYRFADP